MRCRAHGRSDGARGCRAALSLQPMARRVPRQTTTAFAHSERSLKCARTAPVACDLGSQAVRLPHPAKKQLGKSEQTGFTLLEVLVVVVITAILVGALALSVGGTSERQLANTSERFQALFGHACNQAELSGREIGAVVSTDGYTFLRLDGDQWRALTGDDELRARHWPAGMRVELSHEGRPMALATANHDAPQLVCFSSGESTSFTLVLGLGEVPVRYRLKGEDDGTLKADRIESQR